MSGFVALLLFVNAVAVALLTILHMGAIPHRVLKRLSAAKMLDAWAGMAMLAALSLVPINAYAAWIHTKVIPYEIATEAMSRHDFDRDQWGKEIRASRADAEYRKWAAFQGRDDETILQEQSNLWHGWPVMVAIGVGIFLVSMAASRGIHSVVAREIERSLGRRKADLG